MQYRILGNSGLRISCIGFGCMSLKPGQEDAAGILNRALDAGINFFDTADLYDKGENENLVGTALKHRRKEMVLATKVGNQWRTDGSGWDWNPRRAYMLSAVEASLKRLQTDYIDLYQLHGGTIDDPIDETVEAFETLKRQGKILHYGISSIRPNVIRAWTERASPASVMMQYSLLDRRPEESCLPLLQEKGIGLLARGALAQGLLAGKPPEAYLKHDEATVARAAAAVRSLSGPHRKEAATALRFVLRQPAVTSTIVGIRTAQQLEDALKALQTPELKDEEMNALQQSAPSLQYEAHR